MNILALIAASVITATSPVEVADDDARETVLVNFSEASTKAWPSVNDSVMGGRSSGGSRIVDGRMVFSGETRLENNGGFSSIRSRGQTWDISGATELLVKMRGTATRKYTMLLETKERYWGGRVSYWRKFELDGDGWQIIRMPLDEFGPTFRGRNLKGRELDRSDIRSMGLMVYDKKAGPFEVEVEWVKASTPSQTAAPAASVDSGKPGNIVEIARKAGKFNTLLTAAGQAGLADTLSGDGPFTVLAPTDEAFASLPTGTVAELLKPQNRDQLRAILLAHVIKGRLDAAKLLTAGSATTLGGQEVAVTIAEGRLRAGGAKVVLNGVGASNGIIHAIDRVLIPETRSSPGQRVLESAIERGVPLFNEGRVAECAAIYEVALIALIQLGEDDLDQATRDLIATTLEAVKDASDRRSAAWDLRRAMDAAWRALEPSRDG